MVSWIPTSLPSWLSLQPDKNMVGFYCQIILCFMFISIILQDTVKAKELLEKVRDELPGDTLATDEGKILLSCESLRRQVGQ